MQTFESTQKVNVFWSTWYTVVAILVFILLNITYSLFLSLIGAVAIYLLGLSRDYLWITRTTPTSICVGKDEIKIRRYNGKVSRYHPSNTVLERIDGGLFLSRKTGLPVESAFFKDEYWKTDKICSCIKNKAEIKSDEGR